MKQKIEVFLDISSISSFVLIQWCLELVYVKVYNVEPVVIVQYIFLIVLEFCMVVKGEMQGK